MIFKGDHIKSVHFVLIPISEEEKTWLLCPFLHSMYNKTIIKFSFVIYRIIKVLVRVIGLRLQLSLITGTSTLIILDIAKTLCNNWQMCLSNFFSVIISHSYICYSLWSGHSLLYSCCLCVYQALDRSVTGICTINVFRHKPYCPPHIKGAR